MAASKLPAGNDPSPTAMLRTWPGSGWDSANRPRWQVCCGPLQSLLSVHGQASTLRSVCWKCFIYQQEDSQSTCGSLGKSAVSPFPIAFSRITLNKPQTLDHLPLAHLIPWGQLPFCSLHSHLQENPGPKNSPHMFLPWLGNYGLLIPKDLCSHWHVLTSWKLTTFFVSWGLSQIQTEPVNVPSMPQTPNSAQIQRLRV